ncbi:hypothetical protein V8C35DRAFT_316935 [Trichoderma chlorosporum]
MWKGGTDWLSLVESGFKDQQIGTIKYAITTMAFTIWHTAQVSLLIKQWEQRKGSAEAKLKEASQLVTRKVIGDKPAEGFQKRGWEQRRRRVGTHLARGKKWHRLVQTLGFGILFFNPWALVKTLN